MKILIVGGLGHYGAKYKAFVRAGHRVTYLSTFYFVESLWDFEDSLVRYERFASREAMTSGDAFERRVREIVERDAIDAVLVTLNATDGSNEAAVRLAAMGLAIPIVRWYAEHWCRPDEAERIALTRTDGQIYRNEENARWFKDLYGVGDDYMIAFANAPFMEVFVPNDPPAPLSASDGGVHVAILSGIVHGGSRDQGRYGYEEISDVLSGAGVHVHLYGRFVTPEEEAAYRAIEARRPATFHIHGFVFTKKDCRLVMPYDYGVLYSHPRSAWPRLADPSQVDYNRFNYPSRMSQYIAAGVPMILKRGLYPALERLLATYGMGLIFDDYDDLVRRIADRRLHARLRVNVLAFRPSFSMEHQVPRIVAFLKERADAKRARAAAPEGAAR